MDLIQHINQNEVLTKEIENMSNPFYLNLVHPEWLTHLKNNALYQKYLNNQVEFLPQNSTRKYIITQRVKNSENFFKAIVVGRFLHIKSDNCQSTFSALNCEPLEELCKVFVDDKLFPNIIKSNRAKFFIESCGGIYACASCNTFKNKYNLNYDMTKEWWCIKKTKIFNGQKVVLSSKAHVENAFGKNPFFAIFQLEVSGRQFFGLENEKSMKLYGSVKNMILFKESVLELCQPTNLDFIADSCSSHANDVLNESNNSIKIEENNKNEEDNPSSIEAEYEAANLQFKQNFTKAIENNTTAKTEENICLPNSVEIDNLLKREQADDNDEYDVIHAKKTKFC